MQNYSDQIFGLHFIQIFYLRKICKLKQIGSFSADHSHKLCVHSVRGAFVGLGLAADKTFTERALDFIGENAQKVFSSEFWELFMLQLIPMK